MSGLNADIITARAVASLKELLTLSKPLMKKNSFCLFLKGRTAAD
ncbi:RsmG family class I SAM-dependent methyltransferase [Acinetobacter baumannii]